MKEQPSFRTIFIPLSSTHLLEQVVVFLSLRISSANMDRDLSIILSQAHQSSSSAEKAPATDSSTVVGRNYHQINRSHNTQTSYVQGMTPMERFQGEHFGDGPWNNVKYVYAPKK